MPVHCSFSRAFSGRATSTSVQCEASTAVSSQHWATSGARKSRNCPTPANRGVHGANLQALSACSWPTQPIFSDACAAAPTRPCRSTPLPPCALGPGRQPRDAASNANDSSSANPADMMFEDSRWRWPVVGRSTRKQSQQQRKGSAPPPPPPPPPPPNTSSPWDAPPQQGGWGDGRYDYDEEEEIAQRRAAQRAQAQQQQQQQKVGWRERLASLASSDQELAELLREDPAIMQELQRRAGLTDGPVAPPDPAAADYDPQAYSRQLREFLDYKRSQRVERLEGRNDDEITGIALVYFAAAIFIILLGSVWGK